MGRLDDILESIDKSREKPSKLPWSFKKGDRLQSKRPPGSKAALAEGHRECQVIKVTRERMVLEFPNGGVMTLYGEDDHSVDSDLFELA